MAFFQKIKGWFTAKPATPAQDSAAAGLPDLFKEVDQKIEETKVAPTPSVSVDPGPVKSLRDAFLDELRSIPTNRTDAPVERTRHDILDELKKMSPPKDHPSK